MGGRQSLTRNLNGAGKGDLTRPCQVSKEQERKNFEKISGFRCQRYCTCDKCLGLDEGPPVECEDLPRL